MKMIFPTVLLSFCYSLTTAKKLDWETYKPNNKGDVSKYIITKADVKHSKGHTTRVVRYIRGHPTAHIFLLAPSPGQGSKYWETEIPKLKDLYENDFVLYALDLRGCNDSSPFVEEKSESSWSKVKRDMKSGDEKLDLSDLNIAGLSSDLDDTVNRVKEDPGFQGTLHLHSRSFGTLIAIHALDRRGNDYDSVIFESYLPTATWPSVSNDSAFTQVVAKDTLFKTKFNGLDSAQLKNVVAIIGTPGYNACSDALLAEIKKQNYGHLPSSSSDWLRIQEFLMPFFYGKVKLEHEGGHSGGGYHSSLLTIPFLSAVYSCPNLDYFKNTILPEMIKLASKDLPNRYSIFSEETGVNRFSNSFLMMYEVFNMGKESSSDKDHHYCQSNNVMSLGLASPCVLYKYYHKHFDTFHKGLDGHSHDFSKVKALGTRMFFVGGALDLITPLSATIKFYDNSEAKERRLIRFQSLGNHPLSQNICAREIGQEFLGRGGSGSIGATNQCLERVNNEIIDWNLPKLKNATISKWWAIPATSNSTPPDNSKVADDSNTTPLTRSAVLHYIVLVIGVISVLTVVIHVAFMLYSKKKARAALLLEDG